MESAARAIAPTLFGSLFALVMRDHGLGFGPHVPFLCISGFFCAQVPLVACAARGARARPT
jgi:hypothetical protein